MIAIAITITVTVRVDGNFKVAVTFKLPSANPRNDSRAAAQVHRSLYSHAYRRAHRPFCLIKPSLRPGAQTRTYRQQILSQLLPGEKVAWSNWNMEDSCEQICVEQKFCRVSQEKASGPIFWVRIMMSVSVTQRNENERSTIVDLKKHIKRILSSLIFYQ